MRSKWNGDPPPGNRFRFRVRVVRAGEAKLRGRARGVIPPLLGRNQDKCLSSPSGWRRLPGVSRGVPWVSGRCPAGVRGPGVRCPAGVRPVSGVRSIVRSIVRSNVRSDVISIVRSSVRSIVRSIVGSILRSIVRPIGENDSEIDQTDREIDSEIECEIDI